MKFFYWKLYYFVGSVWFFFSVFKVVVFYYFIRLNEINWELCRIIEFGIILNLLYIDMLRDILINVWGINLIIYSFIFLNRFKVGKN